MLSTLRRKLIPGVTWQHPAVSAGLHALDPVDWAVRSLRGFGHLPKLSMRVRSNGLRGQFGGQKFVHMGNIFAQELRDRAGLETTSRVLEIGCGCGRNAFALAPYLEDGNFIGVDIDLPSIEAASRNRFLKARDHRFEFLDVDNPEYNPNGRYKASEYVFDFDDAQFDVIFLVSVVTHLLPKDLENYLTEIARMLKPGGRLVFSTFLMDIALHFGPVRFEHGEGPWRSSHETIPEICVGYHLDYLDKTLSARGMALDGPPVASVHGDRALTGQTTQFGQDIVLACKTR